MTKAVQITLTEEEAQIISVIASIGVACTVAITNDGTNKGHQAEEALEFALITLIEATTPERFGEIATKFITQIRTVAGA